MCSIVLIHIKSLSLFRPSVLDTYGECPSTFWASADGALGVIVPVNQQQYEKFTLIESAIAEVIDPILGIPSSSVTVSSKMNQFYHNTKIVQIQNLFIVDLF